MNPRPRFVRAYLRASTDDQDATRARDSLIGFAQERGHHIAAFYIENETGTRYDRPELFRLLADAQPGDILLCEMVNRLSRLDEPDWLKLRSLIEAKQISIVSLDLPTSFQFLEEPADGGDGFTSWMLRAINAVVLDVLAAVARKDYEDRRRITLQGIEKAKRAGKYKGRPVNTDLHERIKTCLSRDMGVRETARLVGCSKATVQKVKANYERDTARAAG